jgi:hypothetical protein
MSTFDPGDARLRGIGRLMRGACRVIAALGLLGLSAAIQPASAAQITRSNAQGPQTAIAVIGAQNVVYVDENNTGFHNLWNGTGLNTPSIVDDGGTPYYMVVGDDHNLWIATDAWAWKPLGASGVFCYDIGAVLTGTTLTLACEGIDHAVYAGSTIIPAPGQPPSYLVGMHSIGGFIPGTAGGAAVGIVNSKVTYFATGEVGDQGGNEWISTGKGGFSSTPWTCKGQGGIGYNGAVSFFVCHGSDDAPWYTTNSGSGWSGTRSLGGAIADDASPGIAVFGDATANVYVHGTDDAVWVDPSVAPGGKGNGWKSLGGWTSSGVGGSSLGAGGFHTPSWWSGVCDDSHYFAGTGLHAYKLGAVWNGLAACGPRPLHGGKDLVVYFPRAKWGINEWECVELSMRYMYLAWGVFPYPANGDNIAVHYAKYKAQYNPHGPNLLDVKNGTVGGAPIVGDVLSFTNGFPNGHTAVVTASNVDSGGNGTLKVIQENASRDGWGSLSVSNWVVSGGVTDWLQYPT